jgi:hypothetical protein
MKGRPLLEQAKNEDHGTPGEIWESVRCVFQGHPDLDPCGNPFALPSARRVIWLPKWAKYLSGEPRLDPGEINIVPPANAAIGDGLEEQWHGTAYVNPPFHHKVLGRFMEKAQHETWDGRCSAAIMLSPSKTGLKCWQANVGFAAAVCFIGHRLTFLGNEDPALFDCALILWTRDRTLRHRFALELDGTLGQVWTR